MKTQRWASDIISNLPPNVIEMILNLLPIQEAARTSILSRKWRYCFASISKLVFYDKEFKRSTVWFSRAVYQVLLLHRGPILEFSLSLSELKVFSEINQILLHLSMSNNLEKFTLANELTINYKLPSSFFSLQRLTHLELQYCVFQPPSTFNGFNKLVSLHFINVDVTATKLQVFLSNCPQLKHLILIEDRENIVGDKRKFVELFECLPLIEDLNINYYYFTFKCFTANRVPRKLPTPLIHLRILHLTDLCFMEVEEHSAILCLIRSSPNVEIIKVQIAEFCEFEYSHDLQIVMDFLAFEDYSDLILDHLRELEITMFSNLGPEMEFVKLIITKSAKLKKVYIELNNKVSVKEELKMHKDLLQLAFARASPIKEFTVERPKLPLTSNNR